METQNYQRVILAAFKRGNSCRKAPYKIIGDLPPPPSPTDLHLSAKGKANVEFTKGNYLPKQWWGLVCKNIDKLYYEKIGSTEPATTQKQKNLWSKIFRVTVKDIHWDELRLKGQKAISKRKIKNNIIASCPQKTKPVPPPVEEPEVPLSAKEIADERFIAGGYKNARYWWKLVCTGIDELYQRKTGNDDEQEIWKNILGATVDDIHRDELKNKGYDAAMRKSDIKKNITSSCQ
jgi:hypothetical protein